MKIKTAILFLITISNYTVAQTSVFSVASNSTLQYSSTSDNEETKITITKPNYGKTASYSFKYETDFTKKGTVTITASQLKSGARMATFPEMIVKESEKFSDIGSAIWMSQSKFDSVLKHNIYIEYDEAEENGKKIPYNTAYRAKRVRQAVIVDGKSTLIEAIKLTSDTLSSGSMKGVLEFVIQNNKANPLLLQSSSKIWVQSDGKLEEVPVFDLWLKSVTKVK